MFALAVTRSAVGDGFSQGIPGELDTGGVIAGERSDRSANLVSRDMEGTANPFDDEAVAGTQSRGGIRCFSSTTIRIESQDHKEKQNQRTNLTDPYSPTEFQVLPCQDVPPIPLSPPD